LKKQQELEDEVSELKKQLKEEELQSQKLEEETKKERRGKKET